VTSLKELNEHIYTYTRIHIYIFFLVLWQILMQPDIWYIYYTNITISKFHLL